MDKSCNRFTESTFFLFLRVFNFDELDTCI
jgi:hypothetical protein